MANKKSVIAICYDFDGTLSPGNMQEYGFFSGLGSSVAKKFWCESERKAKENHADPILAYMNHMIEEAKVGNVGTTREAFKTYGKSVELFSGVEEWFSRISNYSKKYDIKIEHYIVSSGLKEMIEGSRIGKKFKKIYACSFIYDNNDAAKWPAVAVNYTTKTQFLFRINKGITDDNDNKRINEFIPENEREVPFARIIYIGDGLTDIPCMKLVKEKGGHSIAVYDSNNKHKKKKDTEMLLSDGRVNFIAEADYADNSHLDQIVKTVIDYIAIKMKLSLLVKKPIKFSNPVAAVDYKAFDAEKTHVAVE
jgi:hypothetical protein